MPVLARFSGELTVGELARYEIEFNPSVSVPIFYDQRPQTLLMILKNTSPLISRAALLQGPFVLSASITELHEDLQNSASISPSSSRKRQIVPQLVGSLKAGSDSWPTLLAVPDSAGSLNPCKWIIDIFSEVIFTKKTVSYELLLCTANVQEASISLATSKDLQGSACPAIKITQSSRSEHIWSVPNFSKPRSNNVHLVICSHGLHGTRLDTLYIKERLEQRFSAENRDDGGIVVLATDVNHTLTETGIEPCAERLARYVLGVLHYDASTQTFPSDLIFDRISFIGHSLGGLVLMATVGILYHLTNGKIFHRIKPCNLIAMASPILGVRSSSIYPVKLALENGAIGQTGKDLVLVKRKKENLISPTKSEFSLTSLMTDQMQMEPLLLQMARRDSIVHMAVKMFKERTVYVNSINDPIVPFDTSVIRYVNMKGNENEKEESEAEEEVMKEIATQNGDLRRPEDVQQMQNEEKIDMERIVTQETEIERTVTQDSEIESTVTQYTNTERTVTQGTEKVNVSVADDAEIERTMYVLEDAEVEGAVDVLEDVDSSTAVEEILEVTETTEATTTVDVLDKGTGDLSISSDTEVEISSTVNVQDTIVEATTGEENIPLDISNISQKDTLNETQVQLKESLRDSSVDSQNDSQVDNDMISIRLSVENEEKWDNVKISLEEDKEKFIRDSTTSISTSTSKSKSKPKIKELILVSEQSLKTTPVKEISNNSNSDGSVAEKLSSFFSSIRKISIVSPTISSSSSANTTPPMTPIKSKTSSPSPSPRSPQFEAFRSWSSGFLNNPASIFPTNISGLAFSLNTISSKENNEMIPAKLDPFKALQDILDPPIPHRDLLEYEPDHESSQDIIIHDGYYGPGGYRVDLNNLSSNLDMNITKNDNNDSSIEMQIADEWHADMIWRKRIFALENCDAHANILVRRKWFNVHGWGVIEALVNGHEWE